MQLVLTVFEKILIIQTAVPQRSVPGALCDVQDVLLTLSGQVCYQNRRRVLGLKEHLNTENCLKQGISQKLTA